MSFILPPLLLIGWNRYINIIDPSHLYHLPPSTSHDVENILLSPPAHGLLQQLIDLMLQPLHQRIAQPPYRGDVERAIFLRLRDFPRDGEAAMVLTRARIPRPRGVD